MDNQTNNNFTDVNKEVNTQAPNEKTDIYEPSIEDENTKIPKVHPIRNWIKKRLQWIREHLPHPFQAVMYAISPKSVKEVIYNEAVKVAEEERKEHGQTTVYKKEILNSWNINTEQKIVMLAALAYNKRQDVTVVLGNEKAIRFVRVGETVRIEHGELKQQTKEAEPKYVFRNAGSVVMNTTITNNDKKEVKDIYEMLVKEKSKKIFNSKSFDKKYKAFEKKSINCYDISNTVVLIEKNTPLHNQEPPENIVDANNWGGNENYKITDFEKEFSGHEKDIMESILNNTPRDIILLINHEMNLSMDNFLKGQFNVNEYSKCHEKICKEIEQSRNSKEPVEIQFETSNYTDIVTLGTSIRTQPTVNVLQEQPQDKTEQPQDNVKDTVTKNKIAYQITDKDLDILVNDEKWLVRKTVAEHGRDKDLDILVNDNDCDVRATVAKHGRDKDLDILVKSVYNEKKF